MTAPAINRRWRVRGSDERPAGLDDGTAFGVLGDDLLAERLRRRRTVLLRTGVVAVNRGDGDAMASRGVFRELAEHHVDRGAAPLHRERPADVRGRGWVAIAAKRSDAPSRPSRFVTQPTRHLDASHSSPYRATHLQP